ncbi:MAG: hypothetical protein KKG07_06705 [Gammaproteobacteria bacterium]|nr:hypothetical protein [Gammaproteobacteria bacterium]
MLKHILPCVTIAASSLLSQPALAERFPDVPRPIDYFVNGEEILAVNTLRDEIRAQGNFPLAKALLTIGRDDLLGLNRSLDSFDTGTLETPLGGEFEVDKEQVAEFKTARAQRASRGLNRGFDTPLGGDFSSNSEQIVQFRSERAMRASRGLNRLGYRSGFN